VQPSSSNALGNETVLGSQDSTLAVARKIPRPACPEEPAQTGRVLAPNSDTSGSQTVSVLAMAKGMAGTETGVPWMGIRDVGAVVRRTASLRLHNC